MKKIEPILIFLILLSIVFRGFNISGAEKLLIISLSSVAVYYIAFPYFSKEFFIGINKGLIGFSSRALLLSPLGFMFKIMSWPGGQILLTVALVPSIVLIIIHMVLNNKKRDEAHSFFISRLIFWGILCSITILENYIVI